jgi:hypothetical protein
MFTTHKIKFNFKNKKYLLRVLPLIYFKNSSLTVVNSTMNASSSSGIDRATFERMLLATIILGMVFLAFLSWMEYPRCYFQLVGYKHPRFDSFYPPGSICRPENSECRDNSRTVSAPEEILNSNSPVSQVYRVCDETCTANHPSPQEVAEHLAAVQD